MGKALTGIGLIVTLSTLALNTSAEELPPRVAMRGTQQSYRIIGTEVRDSQDQKVGTIKDFAIDLENGRIVEVLVSSTSGFLGLNQRIVAVPPQALQYDSASKVLRLNVDKERFKAAPEFAMSRWADNYQSHRVAATYRHYDQQPYFAADGQGTRSGNSSVEPIRHVQSSLKLLGLPISNLQYEMLGKVSSFQLDLSKGRVFHVIVEAPGMAQTKCVIPATALKFNSAHDGLYYDVTRAAFLSEPRFQMVNATTGDFQQETYNNAKVAANDGVNTRQNVNDGVASTYTPLAQGSSYGDVELTYRIYAAMRADTTLSKSAQDVEVGTLNRRVTLRGHVHSEEGKRAIGIIAGTAGRPENVSNLIEVRPLPVTSN